MFNPCSFKLSLASQGRQIKQPYYCCSWFSVLETPLQVFNTVGCFHSDFCPCTPTPHPPATAEGLAVGPWSNFFLTLPSAWNVLSTPFYLQICRTSSLTSFKPIYAQKLLSLRRLERFLPATQPGGAGVGRGGCCLPPQRFLGAYRRMFPECIGIAGKMCEDEFLEFAL